MKLIKKCPVFVLLLSTGLLFTMIALGGKNTIYASQEYDPVTTPVLSVMFTAVNDEIYPWQLFINQNAPVMAKGPETGEGRPDETESDEQKEPQENSESTGSYDTDKTGGTDRKENRGESGKANEQGENNGKNDDIKDQGINSGESGETNEQTGENADAGMAENTAKDNGTESEPFKEPDEGEEPEGQQGNVKGSEVKEGDVGTIGADALLNASKAYKKEETGFERLAPLRESTREEYLNHISADIYGDAGVIRAVSYEFQTVDESYFDDALFIGDSRFVGLKDYTDLAEHADFCCETSLTIYKALEEKFSRTGTVPEVLENKDYRKIYMMLGINELGRGTTEDFMGQYTEVIDTLRELEPEAKIFIMGIMRVSEKKSSSDAIFNNSNINARNNAVATLADNKNIFYIDVNEVVCDEEGNLKEEYTFDQIHLLGAYNDLVKQFLLDHGVAE